MGRLVYFLFLIIIIISCSYEHHKENVWTEEYEKDVFSTMGEAVKDRIPNTKQRSDYVHFVIKRFKKALPNGMESVSADSIHKLTISVGKEWGDTLDPFNTGITSAPTKWTYDLEQVMRAGFNKEWGNKNIKSRKKMCDCVIVKLKEIYPDSIILPLEKNLAMSISKQCIIQTGSYKR